MLAFCSIPVAYSGFTLLLKTFKAIANRFDMGSKAYFVGITAVITIFIVFALPSFLSSEVSQKLTLLIRQ